MKRIEPTGSEMLEVLQGKTAEKGSFSTDRERGREHSGSKATPEETALPPFTRSCSPAGFKHHDFALDIGLDFGLVFERQKRVASAFGEAE